MFGKAVKKKTRPRGRIGEDLKRGVWNKTRLLSIRGRENKNFTLREQEGPILHRVWFGERTERGDSRSAKTLG